MIQGVKAPLGWHNPTTLIILQHAVLAQKLSLHIAVAGAADRPVQEIKIKAAHIHANPLAGA